MEMKQIIDITGPGGAKSVQPRTIVFARVGLFEGFRAGDDAQNIVEQSDHHELHFGINITSSGSARSVGVCSVEHAQALIEALQFAIDNDFLFTNKQLSQYHKSATDTRGKIKQAIRYSGEREA